MLLRLRSRLMLQGEVAYNRQPFPRSDCVELLAIDDHLTAPARDTQIFVGAEAAYKHVCLQLLTLVENTAAHTKLQLNWSKSLLLKSPSSQNHVYNQHGEMVKEVDHAKYLRVILSRNGSSKKDVTERLCKARKHLGTLHHFWRHTGLPIVYGMESAALTSRDLHRIEAFHAQSINKMHRIPSTYYTKAITNQQLRQQTSQPTLTHYVQRAQLKLFGNILRASEQCLERNCCLTKAFVYRGGVAGEGLRRGRPRLHWVEQCAAQACRWVQELPNPLFPGTPIFLLHLLSFTGSLYVVHFGVGSWGTQRAGNTPNRPATAFSHRLYTVRVLRRLACRCIRLPETCLASSIRPRPLTHAGKMERGMQSIPLECSSLWHGAGFWSTPAALDRIAKAQHPTQTFDTCRQHGWWCLRDTIASPNSIISAISVVLGLT